MIDGPAPSERLTAIESALMHLQHEVEQLNAAVLGQQRDIDGIRKELERLTGHVERLEQDPETRDPKAEKPPHY